jgi:hypothetical protein
MSPRATGTASQAARERMDAARALLAHPLLTAAHPEELALVRLHAPALRATFKTWLGYNLIVESTFARLVKGPVSPDGPARAARRRTRIWRCCARRCSHLVPVNRPSSPP